MAKPGFSAKPFWEIAQKSTRNGLFIAFYEHDVLDPAFKCQTHQLPHLGRVSPTSRGLRVRRRPSEHGCEEPPQR